MQINHIPSQMVELSKTDYPQYTEAFHDYIQGVSPLTDQSWRDIYSIAKVFFVPAGTILLKPKAKEISVRFLYSGCVKLEHHCHISTFVYDYQAAPCMISDTSSFIKGAKSGSIITAVTELVIVSMSEDLFLPLVNLNIDIAKFSLRTLNSYLVKTQHKQCILRNMSANERYQQFLEEYSEYSNHIKLEDVASYINVAPQSLSRLRRLVSL